MLSSSLLALSLAALSTAHTAVWTPGMYCLDGVSPLDSPNTNLAVNPLYKLTKENWWLLHDRGCDAASPTPGEFLQLPANSNSTIELAHNRAFTTLSHAGKQVTDWPDGKQHPQDWNGGCGRYAECVFERGWSAAYVE
jgi:hypothetical protein